MSSARHEGSDCVNCQSRKSVPAWFAVLPIQRIQSIVMTNSHIHTLSSVAQSNTPPHLCLRKQTNITLYPFVWKAAMECQAFNLHSDSYPELNLLCSCVSVLTFWLCLMSWTLAISHHWLTMATRYLNDPWSEKLTMTWGYGLMLCAQDISLYGIWKIACVWKVLSSDLILHTYMYSNSQKFGHTYSLKGFSLFVQFYCRTIVKTSKLWNNTYGIM